MSYAYNVVTIVYYIQNIVDRHYDIQYYTISYYLYFNYTYIILNENIFILNKFQKY